MRHSLLSPGLILGVSTGAFAEVPFTQPRSPGPYGWNLAQITMMQYASGATSPLGALIMKQLLLALAALFRFLWFLPSRMCLMSRDARTHQLDGSQAPRR